MVQEKIRSRYRKVFLGFDLQSKCIARNVAKTKNCNFLCRLYISGGFLRYGMAPRLIYRRLLQPETLCALGTPKACAGRALSINTDKPRVRT